MQKSEQPKKGRIEEKVKDMDVESEREENVKRKIMTCIET